MKKQILTSLITTTLIFSTSSSLASPEPKDPNKRTPQGLYVDAKETYEMMQKDSKVVLVDVRTPAEWQFVGYTEMAQIMIPSVLFKYNALDDKKPRYRAVINQNFINEFEEKLFDLGADKETKFVLMCRSGATRAQPAAKMLDQYGYKNVYIMTDGFEGGKSKDGEHKGYRLKNGWKFNGYPWTYKINKENAYLEKN